MEYVTTLSGSPLQKRFGVPLHVAHYRSGSFRTHYHRFLELIVVNGDHGHNVIAGRRTPFRRGQVYRLGTFHPHRIEASPDEICDYYNVTFLPECLSLNDRAGSDDRLLEPFYRATPSAPIVLPDAAYDRASALCRLIADEVVRDDPSSPAIAVHLFHALLLVIARDDDDSLPRTDARVRTALRLIAERFDEPLPSRELARAVGVSPARLAQLFRSHTGSTIRRTINRRRLTEAKRLLATTDDPITTILHASGFSDVSYFNRAFRADTGLTPREYRRRAGHHD